MGAGLLELAGAVGLGCVAGRRTEAVLLEALRAAAPAERAVRSADRANMLNSSWLGARKEWINGVVDGGVKCGGSSRRFPISCEAWRASQSQQQIATLIGRRSTSMIPGRFGLATASPSSR